MIALLLFIIGLIVLIATVIGLAVNDIQIAKMQRSLHKHPSARRWRRRPTILLGTPTPLKDLKKSYRKIAIADKSMESDYLILELSDSTVLDQAALINAVQRFNYDASLSKVALLPVVQKPQTARQLLHTYKVIACTPFRILRAILNIDTDNTLSRSESPSRYSFIYQMSSDVLKFLNCTLLIYALFAAAVLTQPELLLTYILALGSWLTWTISRYPHLSLSQKTSLIMLSPASFVLFTFDALTAPLRISRRQVQTQNAIMK
jgi:hypothetical protein